VRLDDIEAKLSPAIGEYIKDVYHSLRDKPYPGVLCLDEVQFKATLKVRDRKTTPEAAYNIPNNTLYFRNRPTEDGVAHELEHWAQAVKMGPDAFIEWLQSEKNFREIEQASREAALANRHKLTGKY